ncbi:DoxX family protein [Pseudoroseomonas ludipueritiae]|uniref:DoxX family protein n=1 Tax=Pseudoroseomonas ludipueritiae TaxID=198093 RepID=A0ABR7RB56_9PROT|nr:DoxX family protein [Pseudoroseomonas ludipueritiae]MBC9178665.1 DoxX family protein [Pseudoroseomonas ludipueritiae]
MARWHPLLAWIGLLGLCAAYIQGGLNKALDYPGAVAEAMHFGLPLPSVAAAMTIALELAASAMVLTGRLRWLGALLLAAFTLAATFIANRYWSLPVGQARFMTANAFYEHLGLAGAFLLVALWDRTPHEH